MLVHLPMPLTIAIDVVVWFAIHMGVSYWMTSRPLNSFNPDAWLHRIRDWEKDGRTYETIFMVRKWKKRLPDGAALLRKGFTKRRLQENNYAYYRDFIKETCRAEVTHWIVFLFGFIFFLWNLWFVGLIMIGYAAVANVPCIIAQRYNRIRFQRVARQLRESRNRCR
jgi:glycosyl-4,4'-diaponeurosporenoate acyltransferase